LALRGLKVTLARLALMVLTVWMAQTAQTALRAILGLAFLLEELLVRFYLRWTAQITTHSGLTTTLKKLIT
jgi:hypothetical protein